MRYVIGDTHFGHENIIEYCDRPFEDAREMNSEMIKRWNEKVDHEDTVIHLGDVSHHPGGPASSWLSMLNGQIVVIRGNHDALGQNAPVHTAETMTIQHGRYQFYLEHQPVGANCWQIHGHAHNNDLVTYPFIHPGAKRINVSAELINYEPIKLDWLVTLADKRVRYETLP